MRINKIFMITMLIAVCFLFFACDNPLVISITDNMVAGRARSITGFTFRIPGEEVSITSDTVTVTLPYGTYVNELTPTITTSPLASISPLSGEEQDFTYPFTYTVTAKDGTTRDYKIIISHFPAVVPSDYVLQDAIKYAVPAPVNNTIIISDNISTDAIEVINNKVITLRDNGNNKRIKLEYNGSMFTVGSGSTLKIEGTLTLEGKEDNTDPLVRVNSGGTLEMTDNAKITGNSKIDTRDGGGVYVSGRFIMYGNSEISGNSAHNGGGVYNAGFFSMRGNSKVIYNTSKFVLNFAIYAGGVFNNNIFEMRDNAFISGNDCASGEGTGYGGGVALYDGARFRMSGGTISGNTVTPPTNGMALSMGGGTSPNNFTAEYGRFDAADNWIPYGEFLPPNAVGYINETIRVVNGALVSP